MRNPFTCQECGHIQDQGTKSSKSKWESTLKCMVELDPDTGRWNPPKEKKCEKCGSSNLEKDIIRCYARKAKLP